MHLLLYLYESDDDGAYSSAEKTFFHIQDIQIEGASATKHRNVLLSYAL